MFGSVDGASDGEWLLLLGAPHFGGSLPDIFGSVDGASDGERLVLLLGAHHFGGIFPDICFDSVDRTSDGEGVAISLRVADGDFMGCEGSFEERSEGCSVNAFFVVSQYHSRTSSCQ